MARLISSATGNLTASGTWSLVDSTSANDTQANNTALTTSYVESQSFTPGAITIDGVAVKLASRASGSPSNTISVRLALGGVTVTGTEITLNVSDLDVCDTTDNNGGWYLFKFAAPVLLVTATAYTVSAKLSATTTAVNLFRSSTAGDWARMLRTTTNQAPTTGDDMHIMGEHTGAGTGNNITVTMDSTSATDYGAASTSPTTPALSVNKRGTFTCGTNTSTTYVLQVSGHFIVYSSGTFNWGTNGTNMPSSSTATFQLDCAADGDFGFWIRSGATANIYGNAISHVSANLNADASAAATSLTTDISTGWKNGDTIAIASTTRTTGDAESKALTADASGTTLTISAISNAHGGGGTTNVIAELINLTRNVVFTSTSSSLVTYFIVQKTATVTFRYAEFKWMGDDSTNPGNGAVSIANFQLLGTTGSQDVQYCSFHDFEDTGFVIGSSTSTSVIFSNNGIYNIGSTTPTTNGGVCFDIGQTSTYGGITLDHNIFILMKSNATNTGLNAVLRLLAFTIVFTNNSLSSLSGTAIRPILMGDGTNYLKRGQFDGNTIHSCNGATAALTIYAGGSSLTPGGILSNSKIWRNNISGIDFNSGTYSAREILLDTLTMFGNVSPNIGIFGSTLSGCSIMIRNGTIDSDATFSTATGISLGTGLNKLLLINSTFGSNHTHTTDISTSTSTTFQIDAINCTFSSGTKISNVQSGMDASYFRSQKHNGSLDNTEMLYRRTTITAEITNRNTASGYAWKIAPNSSSMKSIYPGPSFFDTLKAAVNANLLVTITIKALKNAAYNGNAARLVLVGGIIAGIGSDVTASKAETQKTITGATNATPIVITSNSHGYSNGDRVLIEGVGGNTNANNMWTVANVTTNTFELQGSAGNSNYTSGGTSNKYETLTVTGTPTDAGVVEFYVDCDGTAGAIFIDDVTVSQ